MTDSLTIWGTDYTGVKGFKAGAQSDGPTGKNLYNPATKTDGYYLNSSGVLTAESTCSISDYIAVVPGENYVWSGVSGKTGSNNKRVVGYTTAKAYSQVIKAVSVTGIGIPYENSFTVPTGVYFVRLSYNTADSELMIEHGSTKTSYEPYTNIVNYAYLRPQGTKTITSNGSGIDVAEYATVDVNVSGGGGPDLSNDTVTAATLLVGETAHDSSGTAITGTLTGLDLLQGTLEITAVNPTKTILVGRGLIGWNTNTNRLTASAKILPVGGSVSTYKIPMGYNLIAFTCTSTNPLTFSNLSSGVTVLNNGDPIPITETASVYIVSVVGSSSSTSTRSFTVTGA